MKEWERFKVGTPANKGFNTSCIPFDSVSHTSHVATAINIIQAGEVCPSLVSDESILNDKRILVAWLSPNYWGTGFRYGNIRFDFAFDTLIKGRRFYWVESVAYRIPACRILITDIDRDSQLPRYDPVTKNGPWWFDSSNAQNYYNNHYCLEFMIEAPVSLEALMSLDFVNHHSDYCAIHRNNPKRCKELGLRSNKGGAIFLTRAIVSGADLTSLSIHFIHENGNPTFELEGPFDEFVVRISNKAVFKGSISENAIEATALMYAIMSAYTYGRIEEAKLLAAMYDSVDTFSNVSARVIGTAVGLNDYKMLIDA